ncbi:MAG: FMN-binding protein [Muribaculaceae bacterium]|nr:FMN-binding protein [Muribaculaceae bacterium]
MKIKDRILSFCLVLLMIMAAAISVNKSVFGIDVANHSERQTEASVSNPVSEDENGTVVIHTKDLPGTKTGYAGPVPLDIYIVNGKITDIKALPNAETPSFFERASGLFPLWIGKTVAEADTLKVDAVSGATYSSNAIIDNVKAGLAEYEGADIHSSASVPLKIWIALVVTLAACILPLFVRNKVYHTIQMIANVIVLGFWAGQFLDYSLILKYTSSGFSMPVILVAVPMLVAAFIYPMFGHPQHYCNHICPLGSAQQLMGEISGFKFRMSPKLIKGLDWFRRILWAFLMLLLWTDCLVEWMDLELFQAFMFESASWGIIITASVFVALSTVVSRPYCRFVCPTGSLFKRSENIG